MTDVVLYQTNDGGEIQIVNGREKIDDGLATAAYLSLFGGNEDDSGLADGDSVQWWGNLSETEPAKQYRSQLQYLLRSIPAIPANLRRLEDAAVADLTWLTSDLASSVVAAASMPRLNWVAIEIEIEIDNEVFRLAFETPWLGQ